MINQLRIVISKAPHADHSTKPSVVAKVKTSQGRDFQITAFDSGTPITKQLASNTFVDDICAMPLAESELNIGDTVALNPLTPELQAAYDEMTNRNPIGMAATTIMDIMITSATSLVAKGRIGTERQTGGGFENLRLVNPEKITKGATLTIEYIPSQPPQKIAEVGGIETIITTYPIGISLKTKSGEMIATGTFKLKDLCPKAS